MIRRENTGKTNIENYFKSTQKTRSSRQRAELAVDSRQTLHLVVRRLSPANSIFPFLWLPGRENEGRLSWWKKEDEYSSSSSCSILIFDQLFHNLASIRACSIISRPSLRGEKPFCFLPSNGRGIFCSCGHFSGLDSCLGENILSVMWYLFVRRTRKTLTLGAGRYFKTYRGLILFNPFLRYVTKNLPLRSYPGTVACLRNILGTYGIWVTLEKMPQDEK